MTYKNQILSLNVITKRNTNNYNVELGGTSLRETELKIKDDKNALWS